MNPWALMLFSLLFIVGPWLLMPRRVSDDEIRGILRVFDFVNKVYCAVWHRLDSGGPAPLPRHGPAILIANHTCGIDHLVLQAGCRRVLGFMIAQEYYDFWAIHRICVCLGCIPVRRDGRDLTATRAALRALEDGRVLPIFPEGRIHPSSGEEICEGKPGVAFLALHSRVPVIPAYIRGTPRVKNVWKALILPSNARVMYGKPIDLSDIPEDMHKDRETLKQVTERLMGAIHELHRASHAGEGRPAGTILPSPDHDDNDGHLEDRPRALSESGPASGRA